RRYVAVTSARDEAVARRRAAASTGNLVLAQTWRIAAGLRLVVAAGLRQRRPRLRPPRIRRVAPDHILVFVEERLVLADARPKRLDGRAREVGAQIHFLRRVHRRRGAG